MLKSLRNTTAPLFNGMTPSRNLSTRRPPFMRDEEAASEEDSLLERSQRKARRIWDGFIDFAFQGNILQIAFGLM
jgi:hypothetical protein